MSEPTDQGSTEHAADQVMVIGPDGEPVGTVRMPAAGGTGGAEGETDGGEAADRSPEDVAEMVEQPAKVMRIGTMIKQLLEEVRATELDDASRTRLREIHASSLRELDASLAPELQAELARLMEPFTASTPSDGELRVAQAQLVGWLEGLFHGIQTAVFAQQMAARVQLEQMRKGLPSGAAVGAGVDGGGGATGQYL